MFRMKKTAMEIVRSMETKPAMIDMGAQVLRKWSSRLPRQPSCTQSWCRAVDASLLANDATTLSLVPCARGAVGPRSPFVCGSVRKGMCSDSDRTVLNVGRRLCELVDSTQTSVVPLPETTKPHPEVGPSSPARRWVGSLGSATRTLRVLPAHVDEQNLNSSPSLATDPRAGSRQEQGRPAATRWNMNDLLTRQSGPCVASRRWTGASTHRARRTCACPVVQALVAAALPSPARGLSCAETTKPHPKAGNVGCP